MCIYHVLYTDCMGCIGCIGFCLYLVEGEGRRKDCDQTSPIRTKAIPNPWRTMHLDDGHQVYHQSDINTSTHSETPLLRKKFMYIEEHMELP